MTNLTTIQGDLILESDTTFHESLEVKGNILGKDGKRFCLTVHGNINAGNITAWDIKAGDINARDITAWNINARNINAWNIDAWNITAENITAKNINARNIDALDIYASDIICESRKKKDPNNKTMARIFIQNKSKLTYKNWELEA
jgi:hypothetical protein